MSQPAEYSVIFCWDDPVAEGERGLILERFCDYGLLGDATSWASGFTPDGDVCLTFTAASVTDAFMKGLVALNRVTAGIIPPVPLAGVVISRLDDPGEEDEEELEIHGGIEHT